jgi:hypothetical protein
MATSRLRNLVGLLATIALCACGQDGTRPTPAPSPTITPDVKAAGLLIDQRGVATTLQRAVHVVSFKPFLPRAAYSAVAVIPPLGNQDTPANRGLAFEYRAGGRTMVLSEWPAQNFRIAFANNDVSATPCKPVKYSHDGVVWTTPHGLVMSLQPDGNAGVAQVAGEARALIARGACR